MTNIDELIEVLKQTNKLLKAHQPESKSYLASDEVLTRQQVQDYLGISNATYKRKVKDGTLQPMRIPGGHRFLKRELMDQFLESKRRGRT